jgi:hypothetical protein
MSKLLKEDSRTDAFQPLHNHAHVHVGPVRHQDVNVVACHLSAQDRDLMFHCYLAYQIAYPNRNLSRHYSLAVLWHPHKVHFEIMFCVRPQLVSFHAPTLHNPKARLQGGGFPPSLKGTLKLNRRGLLFTGDFQMKRDGPLMAAIQYVSEGSVQLP